jgi:hypothetical protein
MLQKTKTKFDLVEMADVRHRRMGDRPLRMARGLLWSGDMSDFIGWLCQRVPKPVG